MSANNEALAKKTAQIDVRAILEVQGIYLSTTTIDAIVSAACTPLASHAGAEPKARYSFVCNAGCGVCAVKVAPFEYERTETLEGEHLGSKYQPQIVSSCCGSEVHVYDNEADHWGAEVTLAAPGAAIAAREQEATGIHPTAQTMIDDMNGEIEG